LSEFTTAVQIAKKLAQANNANVWRSSDGILTRLPPD
jgi:hypothetical protein